MQASSKGSLKMKRKKTEKFGASKPNSLTIGSGVHVLTIVITDFRSFSLISTLIAFDHFGEIPEAEILFPLIF